MMKYVYLGISFLCVVIMGGCFYYFLGGFDPVVIKEGQNTSLTLVGKPFKGEYHRNDSLKNIQESVIKLIESSEFNGDYAEVNYVNTGTTEEEVDLFIGAIVYDDELQVPQGFKVKEFNLNRFLVAQLTMHPTVMPNPQKMQEHFQEYAQEKGFQLENQFIAITFKDNKMEVYGIVKD